MLKMIMIVCCSASSEHMMPHENMVHMHHLDMTQVGYVSLILGCCQHHIVQKFYRQHGHFDYCVATCTMYAYVPFYHSI